MINDSAQIPGGMPEGEALPAEPDPLLKYRGRKPADELVDELSSLADGVRMARIANGDTRRIQKNHNLYYGKPLDAKISDNLRADGEFGESIAICINIARNLVRHIMSLITSVPPSVDIRAANTDEHSRERVEVGKSLASNKVLPHVAPYVDKGTEGALSMSVGWVHGWWDDHAGGVWTAPSFDPQDPATAELLQQIVSSGRVHEISQDENGWTQVRLYRGDMCFENVYPSDVLFDDTATSWEDVDDVIVCVWRNRYDLIARYPWAAKDILKAKTRRDLLSERTEARLGHHVGLDMSDWDDKIEVCHYYHRKKPSVPNGRHTIFLADGPWFEDGDLEYTDWPLLRIAPDEVLASARGYCPMTSLGGMQEAFDGVASSMFTNLFAFGKQTIIVKKGSGVERTDLGGMRFVEVDFGPNGESPIKPLDLLHIPPEMVRALELLQSLMEKDAGVNAIARGDPSGVNAGVAINLFTQMTQQFASPTAKSRAAALERAVKLSFEAYRNHPDVPRDLQITGKSKRNQLIEFYGHETEGIDGITIETSNGFNDTVQGKIQLLQQFTQGKFEITKQDAALLLSTGDPNSILEGQSNQKSNILAENEKILNGETPVAVLGDEHLEHLKEHTTVVASPEARENQALMGAYAAHQQMHFAMLKVDVVYQALHPELAPLFMSLNPPPPGATPAGPPQPGQPTQPSAGQQPPHTGNDIHAPPPEQQKPPAPHPESAMHQFAPPPLPQLPHVHPQPQSGPAMPG